MVCLLRLNPLYRQQTLQMFTVLCKSYSCSKVNVNWWETPECFPLKNCKSKMCITFTSIIKSVNGIQFAHLYYDRNSNKPHIQMFSFALRSSSLSNMFKASPTFVPIIIVLEFALRIFEWLYSYFFMYSYNGSVSFVQQTWKSTRKVPENEMVK